MTDFRPGLNLERLVWLMKEAVARCRLDLTGTVVFTEAATGAYAVTPLLAALAGARPVYALTRNTSHGTIEEVTCLTARLARLAQVDGHIQILTEKRPELVAEADIVTNSGHVRPIDGETVRSMRPGAVIPIMYEAWELRPGEVDLEVCRQQGIRVAGTNERHPNVDVFSFLGVMAVKLLLDAGIAVYRSRILVVCDNRFAPFLWQGLVNVGATVEVIADLDEAASIERPDAVLIAMKPRGEAIVGLAEANRIAVQWPGAVVAQFWGDLDRGNLERAGVAYWPLKAPPTGHMGVLPSDVGPEPVVRLQSGGLKAAEVLLRQPTPGVGSDWEYVDAV